MRRNGKELAAQPSRNKKVPPTTGTAEDLAVAAHRLKAHGWTEQAAAYFLSDMRNQSRDRAARRIRRMSDEQLRRRLIGYSAELSREANRRRRGDLIELRSTARWPWRIAT